MSSDITTCTGCMEMCPNQLAHMDIGGCLYVADEYDSEKTLVYVSSDDEKVKDDTLDNKKKDIKLACINQLKSRKRRHAHRYTPSHK